MDNRNEQFTFHTASTTSAVYLSTVNTSTTMPDTLIVQQGTCIREYFCLHEAIQGLMQFGSGCRSSCTTVLFPTKHHGVAGSNRDFSVPVPTPTTSQWMCNNTVLPKMNTTLPRHVYNSFNSLHKITFLFI